MICLRRIAFRTLSVQSTSIYVRPRLIAISSSSSIARQQKPLFPLQKRWISESTTTLKPEAEEIEEAQHGKVSVSTATDLETPPSVDTKDHQSVTSAIEASTGAGTYTSTTNKPLDPSDKASQDHPTESKAGAPQIDSPSPNRVFVGNIFFDTPDESVRELMSQAGEIESFNILKDSNGVSRGFGYVSYKTPESKERAIQLFDAKYFEGRYLVVQEGRGKKFSSARGPNASLTKAAPGRTLFIGNMPYHMSDKDLNDLFARVKNVTDVRVAIDRRTGQPRGFAHADFVDVDSAIKALEELQGLEISGRCLRVDYSSPAAHHQLGNVVEHQEPL